MSAKASALEKSAKNKAACQMKKGVAMNILRAERSCGFNSRVVVVVGKRWISAYAGLVWPTSVNWVWQGVAAVMPRFQS